ncbi:MAG: sigma-70 family RNA polymerase sigma factor [Fimbriimonas sp.]
MLFAALRPQTTTVTDRSHQFEELLRSSHKQAYRLAFRLTGNQAEAEDLVQESFVRAFRFFHRYDTALPFSSWLYRIMSNAHIDSMRRRSKLKTLSIEQTGNEGSTWDFADHESLPDRDLMEATMEQPVQEAIQAMTPEFRTAVILADVEGMAYEDIADTMGTSVGTVRSRIHRGRRQLKSHLMKYHPTTYRRLNSEL